MSDLINQSGQILVVDGIRINGQSDTHAVSAAKSMIAVGNTPAESVKNEFLNRYRCVAEGEKRILSGTTLTAKVYDSTTGNEVAGISESEFSWSDADGNTIATGINHVTISASEHMDGKSEKQFILTWEHPVKYFIGTSERAVTVKQNVFFTLTTDTTKEYMWSTAKEEDDLTDADKKSGMWKTTVGPKPDDGAEYYLWTRVSYDLGITFIYYKSTTYEGPYDSVSHPYNPEAKIKLVLDKYYFERQDKKADGSKGDYIPNQAIKHYFEYEGVDSDTRVHMYSEEGYPLSNSLDVWAKVSDEAAITEKHMRDRSYMNIIVEYNGVVVDRVLVSEHIITPDFAGKLDTDRPETINGRVPSEGDSFFYINSSNQIILRVYQDNDWHDLDGSYSTDDSGVGIPNQHFADVMSKALPYIMKRGESLPVSETGPYSFFQNLAAYSAFIENLFVRNLNVENTVFKTVIGMDTSGNITFKVTYNGNTVFQIDPATGNVFIGKPNTYMSAPEYGFMFNPSKNEIITKNGGFSISDEGKLVTNFMSANSAEIDNSKITNGYFSGYFDCVSIKAEPDDMVLYKSATAYSSQEMSSCYNAAAALGFLGANTSSLPSGNYYSSMYSCSVSTQSTSYPSSIPILASIKYIRILRKMVNEWFDEKEIFAIEFYNEKLDLILVDAPGGLATAARTELSTDIWSDSAAKNRIFSARSIDNKLVWAGRWFLFDVKISIYTGGNRLTVNIPGVNGTADPSSITERGRLYVDTNGFVKAKI